MSMITNVVSEKTDAAKQFSGDANRSIPSREERSRESTAPGQGRSVATSVVSRKERRCRAYLALTAGTGSALIWA